MDREDQRKESLINPLPEVGETPGEDKSPPTVNGTEDVPGGSVALDHEEEVKETPDEDNPAVADHKVDDEAETFQTNHEPEERGTSDEDRTLEPVSRSEGEDVRGEIDGADDEEEAKETSGNSNPPEAEDVLVESNQDDRARETLKEGNSSTNVNEGEREHDEEEPSDEDPNRVIASKHLDANNEPQSQKQGVAFTVKDDPSRLDLKEEEVAEEEDVLRELREQRDELRQQGRRLQTKLAEYLGGRGGAEWRQGGLMDGGRSESQQQQEYRQHLRTLCGLKQQLGARSQRAQEEAEELRLRSRDRLDQVENEWRDLVALKRDAAMAALRRRRGKEATQARVEAVLEAEQLRQDELIKLRLTHFKLRRRIGRLEEELFGGAEPGVDPLLVQYDRLQAAKKEEKRLAEKQDEDASKLEKKMADCSGLLHRVKEKLRCGETEVWRRRSQLAELEAMLSQRRDVLRGIKQARDSLQRDNERLKERRGLAGSRVLLRDMEDTVDQSERLEQRLETLRSRRAALENT